MMLFSFSMQLNHDNFNLLFQRHRNWQHRLVAVLEDGFRFQSELIHIDPVYSCLSVNKLIFLILPTLPRPPSYSPFPWLCKALGQQYDRWFCTVSVMVRYAGDTCGNRNSELNTAASIMGGLTNGFANTLSSDGCVF